MARKILVVRLPESLIEELKIKKMKYNKPISRIVEEALRKVKL